MGIVWGDSRNFDRFPVLKATRLRIKGVTDMANGTKRIKVSPYLWHIMAITLVCAILYYLPVIAGMAGWTVARDNLGIFHDFYGIDFYALVFFAPVVYTAYMLGVQWAIVVAIISTVLIIPYAIAFDPYPNVMFKPASFGIILSAVGAVVAMLQRSDEQRRQSLKELKCLYDIGRVAEENDSIEHFLMAAVTLIPQATRYPGEAEVRITLRDKVLQSPGFDEKGGKLLKEDLMLSGEALGRIEIYSTHGYAYLAKQQPFINTVADRIVSAVHEIELALSLQGYYTQLEEMVEKRTADLEETREKLIRSERLAAVGELASGVGHELRNPLNVIRNCVYLLKMGMDEKADEETLNTLKLLDRQIDISNRIVSDLLDFTRIRPPTRSKVDLNGLIKESLSWVAAPDKTKVTADFNGKSPQVKIDAEQIGRAFANIISNAYQAMNGKGGELKVAIDADDAYAWAQFTDNGCGIPAENLTRIFEPLFTTKPKGIGLGLAITRRLVEQNSGVVSVASKVGEGTTFTVKLPLNERS
ncbi:MAG: ATP-binding protein [Dehalococcoidales bacterium]|nr:ATP-binding protein [Dehalococcoidales bacterium]